MATGLEQGSDSSSRLAGLLAEGEHEEVLAVFQRYPSPEYGSLIAAGFSYPDDMSWENYHGWLERAGLSTTQLAEAMLCAATRW